jgi:hypothetical protein
MSSHQQLHRALRRAESRDRKRKPGMKVSGKTVFTLGKILRQK